MNISVKLLVAAVFVASICNFDAYALAARASAQSSQQRIENYGDWSVRCTNRDGLPPGDMVQMVTDKQTGKQVKVFSIAYAGDRESYGVQAIAPPSLKGFTAAVEAMATRNPAWAMKDG